MKEREREREKRKLICIVMALAFDIISLHQRVLRESREGGKREVCEREREREQTIKWCIVSSSYCLEIDVNSLPLGLYAHGIHMQNKLFYEDGEKKKCTARFKKSIGSKFNIDFHLNELHSCTSLSLSCFFTHRITIKLTT
jgi:hypothetical protein